MPKSDLPNPSEVKILIEKAIELAELTNTPDEHIATRPCRRKRVHLDAEFKLEDKSTKSNLVKFLRKLENYKPTVTKAKNHRSESNPTETAAAATAAKQPKPAGVFLRALSSNHRDAAERMVVHSDLINNTTSTHTTNATTTGGGRQMKQAAGEFYRSSRPNERHLPPASMNDSFATVIGQSPIRATHSNGYFAQVIGQGGARHFSPRTTTTTPMSRTDKAQRILEIHSGPCSAARKRFRSPSNPNNASSSSSSSQQR